MKRDLGDDAVYAEYEAMRESVMSQQQAEANMELHQELIRVIHSAMMYGLPEDDAKLLCYQCGVSMKDVEAYRA